MDRATTPVQRDGGSRGSSSLLLLTGRPCITSQGLRGPPESDRRCSKTSDRRWTVTEHAFSACA
eukprot:14300295-Alexandrium_andersonii.AAC.1